jgi:hypothetical protein
MMRFEFLSGSIPAIFKLEILRKVILDQVFHCIIYFGY